MTQVRGKGRGKRIVFFSSFVYELCKFSIFLSRFFYKEVEDERKLNKKNIGVFTGGIFFCISNSLFMLGM